jgi:hypothetical protein
MFSPVNGQILQPSEVLYKKPILVERGSFRPVTLVNTDMIGCALHQFVHEEVVKDDPGSVVELYEITMRNLLALGEIDYDDFLARADVLAAAGATVLISDFAEHYRLSSYLRRYTNKPIGLTMGIPSLRELFNEKYYEDLEGGILESFGRMFKNNTKLYVYPQKDPETGYLTTVQKLKVAPHLRSLYEHLVDSHVIESIDFYDRDVLDIYSRDVLKKLASGDAEWEQMVPKQVAKVIKEKKYFGYGSEHPQEVLDGVYSEDPIQAAAHDGGFGGKLPGESSSTNGSTRQAASEAVLQGAETGIEAAATETVLNTAPVS